jgi:hypothetical protein
MKKILLFSLIATAVFGSSIDSYQALTSAMQEGKQFTILLDLEKCSGKPGMPMGYFTPGAMMLVRATEKAPERIVTSHLHFTNQSGSPAYEYVKYTFNADNTVTIQTTFYEPQSFKAIGAGHTFNCSMGQGVEVKTP